MNRASEQAHGLVAWWPGGFWPDGELDMIGAKNMVRNGPTVVSDGMLRRANSFATASSQYLELGSAPVTAEPLTMMCWVNPSQTATSLAVMSLGDISATTRWQIITTAAAATYRADSRDTANTSSAAVSTVAGVVGSWSHVAARFNSASSRDIFVNGGDKVNSAVSRTVGTPTGFDIGTRYVTATRGNHWDGLIADVRLYNYSVPDSIIWQCYDPATRWDLYWVPRRRVYSFVSPAVTGNRRRRVICSGVC